MSVSCAFYWLTQLMCSQGMSADMGAMSEGGGGGGLRVTGLCDQQEMWAAGKRDCTWCFVAVQGVRLRDLGKQRERRRSEGSLPGFLAGVFCG